MSNLVAPNEEQRQAIESTAPYLSIVAGPGSGKTFTLTARVNEQLDAYKLSPVDITVITFTRRAAQELKTRIQLTLINTEINKTGNTGISHDYITELTNRAVRKTSRMFIGTFHSWCLRFLRDHSTALGIKGGFTVLDEQDVADIKKTLVGKYGKENLEEVYWRHKMGIHALDFDDLPRLTLQILGEHEALRELIRVPWLYWDEFQDSSPEEWEILKCMAPQHCTIVGDPDQSIYDFRGSSSRYMDLFEKHFDAQQVCLTKNYRSNNLIVDASQELIVHNTERKAIKPCIGMMPLAHDELQGVASITNRGGAPMTAAEHALDFFKEYGLNPRRTVILCRTNRQVDELCEVAKREGVRMQTLASMPMLWKQKGFRLMLNLLRFIDNQNFSFSLEWLIAEKLFPVDEVAWLKLKQAATGATMPAWELAQSLPTFKALRELIEAIGERDPARPVTTDLDMIESSLDTDNFWLMQGRTRRAEEGRLFRGFADQWRMFMERDERATDRRSFLSWTALREAQDEAPISQQHLAATTIHGAKGLEWDTVFVMPVQKGAMPHPRGDLCEERRLMYVALTRASNLCVLLRDDAAQWSQFVDEALPDTTEKEMEIFRKGF